MTVIAESPLAMKSSIVRFLHAGWKLDVEVLDGEFAEDEAREKQVTTRLQTLSHLHKYRDLLVHFGNHSVESFNKTWPWLEDGTSPIHP